MLSFKHSIMPVMLLSIVALAVEAQVRQPGIPILPIRKGIVTGAAISADNRTVALSYYIHARNRPGTDWFAFVATWNLETGKRTIPTHGMGPVAISPDGKWLATGHHDPLKAGRRRMSAATDLAIYSVGETEPAYRLTHQVAGDAKEAQPTPFTLEKYNPVIIAFHPASEHVVWLTQGGQLYRASLKEGERKPLLLHTLPAAPALTPQRAQDIHQQSKIAFAKDGAQLLVTVVCEMPRDQTVTIKQTWSFDIKPDKVEATLTEATSEPEAQEKTPPDKRDEPAKAGPLWSADGSIGLLAQEDGTAKLFRKDEKEPFKVLRLDD